MSSTPTNDATAVATTEQFKSRKFRSLKKDGSDYLIWASHVRTELKARGLLFVITADNENLPTEAQTAKILSTIQLNLEEELMLSYYSVEDPKELWNSLRRDYDRKAAIMLPAAEADWNELRTMDYKTIRDYNQALTTITNTLLHCGVTKTDKDRIHKTISTMNPQIDSVRAGNLRDKNFTTYEALLDKLMEEEEQVHLMIRNARRALPGYTPIKATETQVVEHKGHPYKRKDSRPRQNGNHGNAKNNNDDDNNNNNDKSDDGQKDFICHTCGMEGHIARGCRANSVTKAYYKELKELRLLQKKTTTETNAFETLSNEDFSDDF